MTKQQAINEAIKRSNERPNTRFYVFYNANIFNLDWNNRYQCSEWINRPNDKPILSAVNGSTELE